MKKFLIVGMSIFLLAGCSFNSLTKSKEKQTEEQTKNQGQNEENKQTNGEQGTDNKTEGEQSELTLAAQYFNDIKEINGRKVIQNPLNIMVLVNKEFALPDHYAPKDLVRSKVEYSFGNQDIEQAYLRKEAAHALEKMFADAKSNGVELFAVSGYRSYDTQTGLFNAEVDRVGKEKAIQAVALPGQSEHQTGLTMDISGKSVQLGLVENFGEMPDGKWLAENAHRFGFILRYPKGKEAITGYQYEPWHFRYVGEEAATQIYKHQLTLEEYFHKVKKI